MNLIRNNEQGKIILIDDNETELLELSWLYDEFVWVLNSSVPIIITKELDESFYNNLNYLMNNDYEFFISRNLSYKERDKIKWLSDQCGNLEDEQETDTINRLIIERKNDQFVIWAENPFCSKHGINKEQYVIGFSPAGNGYITKNVNTNISFQSDMVSLYFNTMDKKI